MTARDEVLALFDTLANERDALSMKCDALRAALSEARRHLPQTANWREIDKLLHGAPGALELLERHALYVWPWQQGGRTRWCACISGPDSDNPLGDGDTPGAAIFAAAARLEKPT